MSFSYIQTKVNNLPAFNRGDELLLDLDFLGSAELIAIFEQTLLTEFLTLNTQTRTNAPDQIHLAGFADILGEEQREVDIVITPAGDSFRFVMKMPISSTWKFSDSFWELPISLDSHEAESLLDKFTFSNAFLVLSNEAHHHDGLGIDLVPGINFRGDLAFSGPMSDFTDLSALAGPIQLAGPVDEYRTDPAPTEFLGVRLSAPVPLNFDTGGLTVDATRISIKSPIRERDQAQNASWTDEPGIYLLMNATVDGRPLELIGRYDHQNRKLLTVYGFFSDFAMAGMTTLTDSIGGADVETELPGDVGPLSGLQLVEFGFCLDLQSKSINFISAKVGTNVTWDLIPGVLSMQGLAIGINISSPFTAQNRKIDLVLGGEFAFNDARVGMELGLPSLTIDGALLGDSTLSLGQLITQMCPGLGNVPELNVQTLLLRGNKTSGTLQTSGIIDSLGAIPIGETTLNFDSLAFYLNYTQGGSTTGAIEGKFSLGQATSELSAVVGPQTILNGALANVSLTEIYADISGGQALPDELPEINFAELSITYNLSTGAFKLKGNAAIAYDALPFEGSLATHVELTISRTIATTGSNAKDAYSILVSLNGTGPLAFAEGFNLDAFSLQFSYGTTTGWTLGGTLTTTLFDTQIMLGAHYAATATGKTLKLTATANPELSLISAQDYFEYKWSLLELGITTQNGNKAWQLRLVSNLEIPGIFALGGDLSIATSTTGGKSLSFRPQNLNPINISIPGGEGLGMQVTPFEFGLSKKDAQSGWGFKGIVDIGFEGAVLGKVGELLPTNMRATLFLGAGEARISALNPTGPLSFALPDAGNQALGAFVLQFTEIGVALRPAVGITCELGMGFPQELNTYLKTDVFRVYDPANIMSMARIKATVGAGGIELRFLTSPFMGSNAVTLNGEAWMDISLGQYGKLAFKIPSFRYDAITSYFEASGGIRILEPLALPLSPLQNFLRAVGMDSAADLFPDKLPLEEVDLIDDQGKLKMDAFLNLLGKAGNIPAEVESALRGAGDLLSRLPASFKSYLEFQIPGHLEFKFGFSPNGRVALGIHAPAEPIRFLFPGMVSGYVPTPGLVGIELRKLTLGTLLSGSLFYGDIDVIIDQFDIPSLALSLMLPDNKNFPLPTSDELLRRVILENVWSVIPLSQGVPIPVPVFYDEIAFEYLGIEGLGLQAHIGFPAPDLVAGGSAIVAEFSNFFKDRTYFLDPATAPGGQELKFVFHDEYIQNPEYLGGGKLGTSGTHIEVGTWRYVAQMMNFLKHFRLADLIAATPIENRIGNRSASLAFMNFDGQYLVTTPAEFKEGAYARLNLNQTQQQDFLDVLPAVQAGAAQVSGNEEGLVTFLRGAADLGFMQLSAAFGLAGSNSMGFHTGFRIAGSISSLIELELKGAILVNAPDAGATSSALSDVFPQAVAVETPELSPSPTISQGQCLRFDGNTTHVAVPFQENLKLDEYTVEVWLNLAQDGDAIQTVVGRSNRNYTMRIHSDGKISHAYSMISPVEQVSASGVFPFGQWVHVAIVRKNGTAYTLLNGEKILESEARLPITESDGMLYIGKKQSGSNQYFLKGQMKELRIWKRARAFEEIAEERWERKKGTEMDLIACYHFDADTGSVAIDACGLNHGEIVNGGWEKSDRQLLDSLYFDGASDYIEVPDENGSLELGRYTITAWVKPDYGQEYDYVGLVGKSGRNYVMEMARSRHLGHRFKSPDVDNDGIHSTYVTLPPNKWSFVVIANKGNYAYTSIDGVTKATGNPASGSPVKTGGPLQIGRSTTGEKKGFFKGEIAEIQIRKNYRGGSIYGERFKRLNGTESSIVSAWRMGEANNGVLKDVFGRNDAKVFVKGYEQVPFAPSGLVFSGEADYVRTPEHEVFHSQRYTVEMWIRPTNPDQTWQCLFYEKDGKLRIWLNKNGMIRHFEKNVDGEEHIHDTPTGLVKFGEWTHIAVVSLKGKVLTWINGKAYGKNKPGGYWPGKTWYRIGSLNAPSNSFTGEIADVRIWKWDLWGAELNSRRFTGPTGNEKNLVAHYTMDPGFGEILIDRGQNLLHGSIHGPAVEESVLPAPAAKAPVAGEKTALQVYGHTHLVVAGHKALEGDIEITGEQVWFKGTLNLFPKRWPLKVFGEAEGYFSKSGFSLSSQSKVQLCGMNLASSNVLLTHEMMKIRGTWLGMKTLLDVAWTGNDPHITGSAGIKFSRKLSLGAVHIRGQKVADNVKIQVVFDLSFGVRVDKDEFSANVVAKCKIAGHGFDFQRRIQQANDPIEDIVRMIRNAILRDTEKYLSHLFADAEAWLSSLADETIELLENVGAEIGKVLSEGYGLTKEAATDALKATNYAIHKVTDVLHAGYGQGAQAIASLMRTAGYTNVLLGEAMRHFNQTVQEAAQILKNIGLYATDLGYALKNGFLASANDVARQLRDLYSVQHAVRILKNLFNKSAGDIANTMKAIGTQSEDLLRGLGDEFSNLDSKELAKALKSGGYASKYIAKSLKKVRGKGVDACCKILKQVGYSKGTAEDALDYAGYGWSAIQDALTSIF